MAAANGSRPRYRRAWVDSEQNARIAASGSRRSRKIYRHRLRPICPIPRSMSHPVLPNTSPGRCAQSHHQAKLVAPVNVPEVEAATAEAPTPMQQQPKRVEQQDQQTHKQGHWSEQRQRTEWGRVLQVCLRLAFDQYDASHQQLAPPEPNAPLLLTAGTSAGTCAAAAHASVPAAPYDGLDAIVANSSICPSLIKQGKPLSQFLFICHTPVFPHLSRFSLPPFVALPCFPMCHAPVSAPSQYLPKRKHGCVGS